MIIRDPRAEANGTRGAIVERFTETDRHHADHPRLARPADPAPVRRPLAAGLLRRPSRRPTGAPRCTTSSTSATSTTASPNRRWACRWTSARSPSCRTRPSSTCTSPRCRRCCSTSKKDPGQFVNRATDPGLRREARRILSEDARLAPGLRRPHADRLSRHAERPRSASRVVFAGSAPSVARLLFGARTSRSAHEIMMRTCRSALA